MTDGKCSSCEFCEEWIDRDGNIRRNCEVDGDPVQPDSECRTGKRRGKEC